jgi:5'(3')-deoxyribonucleotidase
MKLCETYKNRLQTLAGIIGESDLNLKSNDCQVWFDLDGVLADMDGSLEKNKELNSLKEILDNIIDEDFPQYKGLSNDLLKNKINSDLEKDPNNENLKKIKKSFKNYNNFVFKVAGRPGFYISLDLMPQAKEMLVKSKELTGKKPNILTSPTGNENDPNNPAVKEKREWVEMNFGNLVNHIEITSNKGRVVESEKDILIDDREKYVKKFTDAGGTAILFKNPEQAMIELENICKKYNEKI